MKRYDAGTGEHTNPGTPVACEAVHQKRDSLAGPRHMATHRFTLTFFRIQHKA